MKTSEYTFKSATGVCNIYGCEYAPDNDDVSAVVVLHHGMAEHQGRYRDFIEYLVSRGYAVFMHDMANHGKSNQNFSETGYFGLKDGWKNLVRDLNTNFEKAKSAYPDKKMIVMGHSMGSFIVRCFTAWYADAGFDAAVYMGTGGSNPVAAVGDMLSAAVSKIKGAVYKSKMLDKLTFGTYNDKFEKRTKYDWLTRDKDVVDQYIADKYCGFLFSAQGMNDLIKLNISANSSDWYAKVPVDLPVLVISGAMDPVGNYAKGIKEVYDKLAATGHTKAENKLFPDARHELLNELNKDEVYAFLNDFIKKTING